MNSHTTGPRFKTRWVWYTFYRASDWLPPYLHQEVECLLVCVEDGGRISRSGLTQYMKNSKWVFVYSSVMLHINGEHNDWSALCLYTVTGCHVCLWHGIPVWQHIGQSTPASSRHLHNINMTSDV